MEFLGYKSKKGKVKYFCNNITNPTYFLSTNKGAEGVEGCQPIFYLTFTINSFSKTASGGEIDLIDVDENKRYYVLNREIASLLKAIQNGDITINNGQFRALFKMVKNGKTYSIVLATQDDIDDIMVDIPENILVS